ncbi:MAG: hypothetical protein KME29_14680 [Calothrix sp. FI2-JRJ7]|nr:hypothetical protein [Calothrix sp. FI2-JRJ7]
MAIEDKAPYLYISHSYRALYKNSHVELELLMQYTMQPDSWENMEYKKFLDRRR